MFIYHYNLKYVNDYNSMRKLIVSNKLFATLDDETKSYTGVEQGEELFKFKQIRRSVRFVLFYSTKIFKKKGKYLRDERHDLIKN